MLRARLKVVEGKHVGKAIPLTGAKFLIGREQDCQLRPTSELVSRHHCAITVDDFTVRLRDLGSTNGTFVNDERVNGQVTLESGDHIRVGKLHFEIEIVKLSEQEIQKLRGPESATALADILSEAAGADTSQLTGADTAHELRLPLSVPVGDSATDQAGDGTGDPDSGSFELAPGQPAAAANATVPQDSAEPDTTVAAQQTIVPGSPAYSNPPQQMGIPYPQPVQYQPVGQYPPMPAPYPQQPMPYQQPVMPYPQPGMYPPPGYPLQQHPGAYPQQPPAAVPEAPPEPEAGGTVDAPPVLLPDPSETGHKPEVPVEKPAATESADGEAPQTNPSEEAANIIRQHMERRPEV